MDMKTFGGLEALQDQLSFMRHAKAGKRPSHVPGGSGQLRLWSAVGHAPSNKTAAYFGSACFNPKIQNVVWLSFLDYAAGEIS
ncbi:hypothetical protein ABID16_002604 [Rhizobium aquaticum]|uniref:Uncharacterized protein n=1 Tax=Rhizobium aquaticum TaxID=1549636 RepID=A0ABV2J0I6_9HYPH